MGDVIGVPPLHLHVHERGSRAPSQCNAVCGHLAGAGGALVQAVGVASGHDHRLRLDDDVIAGQHVEAEHAGNCTVGVPQEGGGDGFFQPRDARADDLLAPEIHEWHAGITLHVCSNAADIARAGDDIPGVVATEIQARFLELRIINAFDPFAAATRPALIDQELIVVLDEKFGGVARFLIGVTKQFAGDHQVAGEQRGAAFPDEALANDERRDALAVQA